MAEIPTYGSTVAPPTQDELIKCCSIVNVLRERERCAKIAEEVTEQLILVGMDDFNAARRKLGTLIASKIRGQPEDFKTLGELMEEENYSYGHGVPRDL